MTAAAALSPLVLPAPHELWARWAAQGCALTAIGFQDVVWADHVGMHTDDHGGNYSHLRLIEGGRAVLYGLDHEYSDTTWATPPIDLLQGAPSWVPVADIEEDCPGDGLGFLVWWEDESWRRVSYPEGINDGLLAVCSAALDDERAAREAAGVVWDWGACSDDRPLVRDEVAAAASALVKAAHGRVVTSEALGQLVGRLESEGIAVDLEAGMAAARHAGICDGSSPALNQPRERPRGPRRRRRLSAEQHDSLVWSAMRSEQELPRSAPRSARRPLRRLLRWLRARTPTPDGRGELLIWLVRTSAGAGSSELSPFAPGTQNGFSDFVALAAELQEREEVAGQGRWIFLRVRVSPFGHVVERAYDHWPRWWPTEAPDGPSLDALRLEIASRDPLWRPGWAEQLAIEVAHEDVEDEPR